MKLIFSHLFLFISLITAGQSNNSDQAVKDAVWHLEENYWNYVKTQDLVAYAKLWDEKFIGYPSNNKIAGKDHITDWIGKLYSDTTKPTGQGIGLGLSLSYDIIKAHGGELKVDARESEGTAFIISLQV